MGRGAFDLVKHLVKCFAIGGSLHGGAFICAALCGCGSPTPLFDRRLAVAVAHQPFPLHCRGLLHPHPRNECRCTVLSFRGNFVPLLACMHACSQQPLAAEIQALLMTLQGASDMININFGRWHHATGPSLAVCFSWLGALELCLGCTQR